MKAAITLALRLVGLSMVLTLCACTKTSQVLNPFYEPPSDLALLGDANDHALNGTGESEDTARQAMEAMASYKRAHAPEPVNPVVNPAVVRLMWVPDHLNSHGDLVPAHFYYLKVLDDRWAVTDAFELEQQLNRGQGGSGVPFIREGQSYGR